MTPETGREKSLKVSGKNILIVDDEKGLTQALDSFLKTKGYNVFIAHSGKPALDFLQKEKIDLLVLDLNVTDIHGSEIARIAKEKSPRPKILIITGYAEEYKDGISALEAEEVITKPFGMIMFINKVQELLGQEPDLRHAKVTEASGHGPVKVLFIDPAMDCILKDYVLPYMQLSWGDNIEVESINPVRPSLAREKIVSFKPDIVLLSALIAEQTEGLSLDIVKNIYRPKEAIIYNVPATKDTKENPVDAYYAMQKSLIDPDYLNRLNELIKQTAIKHGLVDKKLFIRKQIQMARPKEIFTVDDIGYFVKDAISKALGIERDKIADSACFAEDLGVDSLDTIELTMALEDLFGVELADEDISSLKTVGSAIEYIKKKTDPKEFAKRKKAQYKILIVDDQESMCRFLESYFQAKDYQTCSTTDPGKAFFLAEKEKPDAVLLDIQMPGTSGMEILRKIKQVQPSTKVIMVSVALEKKEEATRLGADAFISKPFPVTYLEKTVMAKIKELMP